VLTKRIRWFEDSIGSLSFNHCWMIWDRQHRGPPTLAYASGVAQIRAQAGPAIAAPRPQAKSTMARSPQFRSLQATRRSTFLTIGSIRPKREVAVFKQITDQPARALGYNDRIRLGQRLQASGDIRGFADNASLLCGALTNEITDHDEAGCTTPATIISTTNSVTDRRGPRVRRPGVPLISHSALSRYVGAALLLGISLRAIAIALTKTREELERQGVAAIWFEVVKSHKQNGGNDADAEDVNESQHSDIPRLLRSLRGHCGIGAFTAPRSSMFSPRSSSPSAF